MPVPHSTYYRDRYSERDLCHDFPGDEILIDGLHAMQRHFWNNNVSIDIPVVRVMNTAHFIAAYMFATSCSGDQMEYDALAYDSFCRDRQLMQVTIIVLAAMLQRTDGLRAKQCRNVLLQDRSPDFDYGVTLYDKFLRSAEKRFAEEDFLMDTGAQIQRLQAENQQLRTENNNLKYTITTMEEQQNKPQTIVYNYGTYNDIHDNPYSTIYTAQPEEKKEADGAERRPRENDYAALVAWLEVEKAQGRDYFADAGMNRSRMCRDLSDILGWIVDQNSLRKAQNK
ncbi:MAG: hypothetical protein IKO66_05540 [Paludibacteraceae bacterium]|nr:hypothetical protein [Paludibacteraceae bacterium]